MKKLFLTAIVLLTMNLSYSQSSCSCDEMFGSCNVTCPAETYPNCKGTWYNSCSCSCIPYSGPAPKTIQTAGINVIILKDLDKLQNIFTETKNDNLANLSKLKRDLTDKSNNGVFTASNEKEYDNYINILKLMFSSLDTTNKVKLVSLIES